MGILSWLLRTDDPQDAENQERINETVERLMRLHPHLRLVRRYQAKLAPAVATALKYVADLVDSVPPARELSASAWASDPYVHAYFASVGDVAELVSRSADLRTYFEHNPDLAEAYAVLGMAMTERHVLGIGLEGETLRRDVQQTTVSFSDHQVRICGRTEPDLRAEVVRRLLDQLAIEGMARIAAEKTRRDKLKREQALLRTRVRLLERQGAGIRSVVGSGGEAEPSGELAQLEQRLTENERKLGSLGLQSDALEHELECICDVFAKPEQHIHLSSKRLRLNRMNVVQEAHSTEASDELEVPLARIPTTPPRERAFSVVRFARREMLPPKSMLKEAERLLC